MNQQLIDFDGATYERQHDHQRLDSALARVYHLMRDGRWRTLPEIAEFAECSQQGASARLRDLRKEKFQERFPCSSVDRRRVEGGVYEYRVNGNQT